MGRLVVIGIQSVQDNNKALLADCLEPDMIDIVVAAVKKVCGFGGPGRQKVQIPSLALTMDHSIKKCAGILCGRALRAKDNELLQEVDNFLKLMEAEWEYRISHHSLTTLSERKYNQVPVLTEDIDKLRRYMDAQIKEKSNELEETPTTTSWTSLAKLLLARLVMLNKRRGGEAAKIEISSYQCRPDWTKSCNQVIRNSLSNFEQELSRR